MPNEYPSHNHLKQYGIPPGKTNANLPNEYHTPPYLKKPEMPMSKFTKRIVRTPTLCKYKHNFTKRIVPVLIIESSSRHRFTHELNSSKNTPFTKRIPSGLGRSCCYSNLLLTPT